MSELLDCSTSCLQKVKSTVIFFVSAVLSTGVASLFSNSAKLMPESVKFFNALQKLCNAQCVIRLLFAHRYNTL